MQRGNQAVSGGLGVGVGRGNARQPGPRPGPARPSLRPCWQGRAVAYSRPSRAALLGQKPACALRWTSTPLPPLPLCLNIGAGDQETFRTLFRVACNRDLDGFQCKWTLLAIRTTDYIYQWPETIGKSNRRQRSRLGLCQRCGDFDAWSTWPRFLPRPNFLWDFLVTRTRKLE